MFRELTAAGGDDYDMDDDYWGDWYGDDYGDDQGPGGDAAEMDDVMDDSMLSMMTGEGDMFAMAECLPYSSYEDHSSSTSFNAVELCSSNVQPQFPKSVIIIILLNTY